MQFLTNYAVIIKIFKAEYHVIEWLMNIMVKPVTSQICNRTF